MNERLIQRRNEMGYTQKQLAEKIGIKQSSLSLIEKGKRNGTDENKIALANALGTTVEWLFFENRYCVSH